MPYHHYVSAFHLAEFTPERNRKGRLHVFDLVERRRWKTSVNSAGGETGYNALEEIPGADPEEMEQYFSSRLENPAAPVLRVINDTAQLPEQAASFVLLLRYLALLAANNPAPRAAIEGAQRQALRFMAQMMAADPEEFEETRAVYDKAGVPILGTIGYDELARRIEDDDFTRRRPPIAHLRGLGHSVDLVTELLAERNWGVLVSSDAMPFICGDHPVTLVRSQGDPQRIPNPFPPGFADRDSEITVPLGPRVTLLGSYGPVPGQRSAGTGVVAEVNRRTLRHATRFVYSREPRFSFLHPDGTVHDSDKLINVKNAP